MNFLERKQLSNIKLNLNSIKLEFMNEELYVILKRNENNYR
jgi:hypothetical protein